MKTDEETVEKTLQKFWFHAGDWHNADCAFVCVDHGVCNCNTTANKKEITNTLKAVREEEREKVIKKASIEILSCVTAEGDDCYFLRVSKDSPLLQTLNHAISTDHIKGWVTVNVDKKII
jgi:hypothetical protein